MRDLLGPVPVQVMIARELPCECACFDRPAPARACRVFAPGHHVDPGKKSRTAGSFAGESGSNSRLMGTISSTKL